MKIKIYLIVLLFLSYNSYSDETDLMKIMQLELDRSFNELKNQEIKPYFISYQITENDNYQITSSLGNTILSTEIKKRTLDVDLRVGDYTFDNTHIIRGSAFQFGSSGGSVSLPFENNEMSIRQKIWNLTDRHYKSAIERYGKAKTNKAVKVEEEDLSDDFSKESNEIYTNDIKKIKFDKELLENRLNNVSRYFRLHPWILSSSINLQIDNITKFFVNTEGTKIRQTQPYIRIMINANTKADDGMTLPLYKSYFAYSIDSLPSEKIMQNDLLEMVNILDGLRNAPVAKTYSGPAILSGEAAGVFFHEIFGHRVEGHREKDPNSSQTFKQMIGKDILPDFINVVFDPTKKILRNHEISGFYNYDDEGVKSQRVVSVENGIFKGFLMSRSPIENFPVSNGHGRKQAGFKAVTRQSNLIVEAIETIPFSELKKELIEICKTEGKEYGLYLTVVQGGFTFTSRTIPNAFNVMPLVVYKIYADGRPDELVRGVDLIGTPLMTFKNITHAADDIGVFNGICGAESGGVPVSASSPSLLVSNIEVQKKKKSQAKPPILDAPDIFKTP